MEHSVPLVPAAPFLSWGRGGVSRRPSLSPNTWHTWPRKVEQGAEGLHMHEPWNSCAQPWSLAGAEPVQGAGVA